MSSTETVRESINWNNTLTARDVWPLATEAQGAVLATLGMESAGHISDLPKDARARAWETFSQVREASEILYLAVEILDRIKETFSKRFEEDPGDVQENPAGQGGKGELLRDAARKTQELESLLLRLLRHEATLIDKKGWETVQGLGTATQHVHDTLTLLQKAL